VSPKSRGRTPKRRPKRVQHATRQLRLSDRVLRDARQIVSGSTALGVEEWASEWFGRAWLAAPLGEREPEHSLCMEVVGRASSRPSPPALAAVAALRRVAPENELSMLDGTVEILAESQPRPPWIDTAGAVPVSAWRAVNVWDSERVLFVEFESPTPHTLAAPVETTSGLLVGALALLEPGAALSWARSRDPDDVPMPLVERPVEAVLAELADAMRMTDMTLPRQDDENYVRLRALAWSRCRAHLPSLADWEPQPEPDREFIDEFVSAEASDDVVTRSLAELFLDYGGGYLTAGPLCWSPGQVELFLTDWLPRKAVLDGAQREALPSVLRRWVRFALRQRGVEQRWIEPVERAVDAHAPEFAAAFDDRSSWGPAKQIAAELAARGVDLTDPAAVDAAVSALNAERLAQRLLDE
jgi:hypothetical protein